MVYELRVDVIEQLNKTGFFSYTWLLCGAFDYLLKGKSKIEFECLGPFCMLILTNCFSYKGVSLDREGTCNTRP
jgi:hypothetical protein